MNNMDNAIKTVLIGASTTGKTSIVKRLLFGTFTTGTECTIGVSFSKFKNNNVEYQLWDTAGQERFRALLPMYFRSARILIFVFNVDDLTTIGDFDKNIGMLNNLENYKLLVVGNKIDLFDEKLKDEELKKEKIKTVDNIVRNKFESSIFYNIIHDYIYVSAKTGENFDVLVDKLDECAINIGATTKKNNIIINKPNVETVKGGCAC